jgi:hypothetical protein
MYRASTGNPESGLALGQEYMGLLFILFRVGSIFRRRGKGVWRGDLIMYE